MFKIKKVPKTDFDQFAKLAADAFPGMGYHTTEEKKKLQLNLLKRHNPKLANLYGAYDKKELLGGLMLYDFEMNMLGEKVLCGGGGFLSISLLHKKMHVAKDICQFFIDHYYKQNSPVISLYPFRPDFYKKMGVGYGAKSQIYNFQPRQLPDGGDRNNLVELSKKDCMEMVKCFNQFADSQNGMFYDSKLLRERFLRQYTKSRIVGYKKNGKLLGFLVYSFVNSDPENFIANKLIIDQFVYLNRESFLALCGFLKRQDDQIETIQYLSFDESFQYNLLDPRFVENKFYMPVYHKTDEGAVGIMYRIINNELFFRTLKEHSFNNQNIKLKLIINDSFFKPNNNSLIVHFNDGYPEIKSANSNFEVAIELDIADFSSLALGAVDFKSLYLYGLIKLSDEKYLDQLDQLFKVKQKPFCLTAF